MSKVILKSIGYGLGATFVLLAVYFLVLTLVSGWSFAQSQFAEFWYFIISLAVGFGVQIALYQYIKTLVHSGQGMGKVVGVSGTTSTIAMISCCAHYLVNLLPILGVTGIVTFVAQYQVKLFWVGIFFNLAGIGYMAKRIIKFKKQT
jgi:Cu+-exporting ATPase